MENIEIEKDPLGVNEDFLVRMEYCPFCNKSVKDKEKFRTRFINIGVQNEQFICCNCGNRVNFSGEKVIFDKWGVHFGKTNN